MEFGNNAFKLGALDMKKALFIIAAVLSPGAASAADMAVKAPVVAPVPVYNWTGFYVGVHGGGSWTDGGSDFDPQFNGVTNIAAWNRSPEVFGLSHSGAVAGVHAGYNWQAAPMLVVGIEGDWSWTDNNTSSTVNTRTAGGVPFVPASPSTMSRNLDWLASIRGRLGFLATPNLLLYGTAGAAFGHTKYNATLSSVPPGTVWAVSFDDDSRVGWVAGGGGEWALTSNWLLRAEYLFYRLPGASAVATGNPNNFPGFTIRYNWHDFDVNVVRVGVSYKFGGPVVAKY
jgi:outer membrane immunogenic protein